MTQSRVWRWFIYSGAAVLLGLTYIVAAGSVPKRVTDRDLKAIGMLHADAACAGMNSFDREVNCIRTVQHAVQSSVPNRHCANHGEEIEPLNFLERQYGCCYDRSRFIEKALDHYGLETRHVFILDEYAHGLLALLIPNNPTHASTEVHTRRGWMGVDSNWSFLLLSRDGRPLTYDRVGEVPTDVLSRAKFPRSFSSHPLIIIYGLYSRHGRFFGPKLPAPEINYPELLRHNV